jgi:hypothetical protein
VRLDSWRRFRTDNLQSEHRVRVPDPALMRRAGNRMIRTLIIVLVLVTPLTVGGLSLVAAGELPGLPLAIGGAVLELAAVAVTAAAFRVRSTLDHETISRTSLLAARRPLGRSGSAAS